MGFAPPASRSASRPPRAPTSESTPRPKMARSDSFNIGDGIAIVLGEIPKVGDVVSFIPVGSYSTNAFYSHPVTNHFTRDDIRDALYFSSGSSVRVYRRGAHVGTFFLEPHDKDQAYSSDRF